MLNAQSVYVVKTVLTVRVAPVHAQAQRLVPVRNAILLLNVSVTAVRKVTAPAGVQVKQPVPAYSVRGVQSTQPTVTATS